MTQERIENLIFRWTLVLSGVRALYFATDYPICTYVFAGAFGLAYMVVVLSGFTSLFFAGPVGPVIVLMNMIDLSERGLKSASNWLTAKE